MLTPMGRHMLAHMLCPRSHAEATLRGRRRVAGGRRRRRSAMQGRAHEGTMGEARRDPPWDSRATTRSCMSGAAGS